MAFFDYYGINKQLFSAFQPILSSFNKKRIFRKKNAKAIGLRLWRYKYFYFKNLKDQIAFFDYFLTKIGPGMMALLQFNLPRLCTVTNTKMSRL